MTDSYYISQRRGVVQVDNNGRWSEIDPATGEVMQTGVGRPPTPLAVQRTVRDEWPKRSRKVAP
jgi:hypothetical protein